nr:MAG TPA: minor structural protein [Caudoviricetes sp.]
MQIRRTRPANRRDRKACGSHDKRSGERINHDCRRHQNSPGGRSGWSGRSSPEGQRQGWKGHGSGCRKRWILRPRRQIQRREQWKTSAENALKKAAEALKAIGGSGDPAKIADDIAAAKATLDNLQASHQAEIAKIQKNTALRMALADQAHDPTDIISLLDMGKVEVDAAGTLKSDLEGLLSPSGKLSLTFSSPRKLPDRISRAQRPPMQPSGRTRRRRLTLLSYFNQQCRKDDFQWQEQKQLA